MEHVKNFGTISNELTWVIGIPEEVLKIMAKILQVQRTSSSIKKKQEHSSRIKTNTHVSMSFSNCWKQNILKVEEKRQITYRDKRSELQ